MSNQDRIFEFEQRCAALEEQADLDTIRMGRLAESNKKLKELNREMFVSRCQAHMSAEAAEQDAARFRMLLQQHKHWLGVFRCDPDGAPSDSLDHVELKALLDQLIEREPAPDCKTPAGCAENGCLGWCDAHSPAAAPDSKTPNTELVDKTSETLRRQVDKIPETPSRRHAIENDTEALLRLCADDPMWAEHAEVSKSLLVRAADELAALRKTAEQLQKLVSSKTPNVEANRETTR